MALEHVLRLKEGERSPPATIGAVAFLAGQWQGEALGGVCEEIWSPPQQGTMMGMFRLLHEDGVAFYELLTIVETAGSLVLRLKHFHPDLTGWEEKGETVDFPLVKLGPEAVYFEGMTIRPVGDDGLQIYLAVNGEEGPAKELLFEYRRVGSSFG